MVLLASFRVRIDDQGSLLWFVLNLSIGRISVRPKHLFDQLRPGLLIQTPFAGSGMPIQLVGVLLPTISDFELSRVRTELE